MKKILVPIDFSEHTETVCRYALEIIKKTGGEIRLFHAYYDFLISTGSVFPYTIETEGVFNQEMMVRVRSDARKDMKHIHQQLMDEIKAASIKNVRIVFTLTGGLPEEEILNISETYAPDLIIMGTRGKGEKDILTGKVSSKVVQSATCRILTVPRNAEYRGFSNILYLTDFSDEDNRDIERLIELFSRDKPDIYCIHINTERHNEDVEIKMEKLKSYFQTYYPDLTIHFDIVCNNDFLDCVKSYVNEKHIDLISVLHRRKSFLRRLFVKDHTRTLLFHSDLPLYIFPEVED
jgi:nucleotide-binding universal stress UspA family protein